MLHTPDWRPAGPEVDVARVECRARHWDVVRRRQEARGTQWYLSQGDAPARLIASPPDDVRLLPATWRQVRRRAALLALQMATEHAPPAWWPRHAAHLPIHPQPWQMVPAMALLSGHHRRLLLADEIGLGKTIAAGVLVTELLARDADAAILIVVPAGLVAQWLDELRGRLDIEARLLDADAFRREAAHPRAVIDAGRAGTCRVLSLDLLRQPDVPGLLTRTRWTQLVVDEAHLAAPGSARHDALARVADVSERVLLLTGTPTAAGLHGAEALRRLGGRSGERPMTVLCRTSRGLTRPPARRRFLRAALDADHAALVARLDRFALRARRERGNDGLLPALVLQRRALSCPAAVACSLARRLEVLGTAPLPQQPSLWTGDPDTAADRDDEEQVLRLPAWHDTDAERRELRELAVIAGRLPPAGRKLRAVVRLLRRAREPAIVFTMYRDTLRQLRGLLGELDAVVIHGLQPVALRQAAIAAFTSGGAGVLLTTDASAEGLNLQARCRLVIHAEVPPSARVLLQRIGRVDRYGQARRVHSIVLASAARADRDALVRLCEVQQAGEAWLRAEGALSCRRTRLAMRVEASTELPRTGGDRPCAAVVPRRRWRRLVARLRLPDGTGAVRWGRLQFGGLALARCSVPVLVATPAGTPPPGAWAAGSWRRLLRPAVRRAERLATRLATWRVEAHAAVTAASEGPSSRPQLFDDGRHVPAPPPDADAEPASVTFRVDGRLEPRR